MNFDWRTLPADIDVKPFTEQKLLILKSTGRVSAVTGWEQYDLVTEIWLPIKVRSPEEYDEIVKQYSGDQWCATIEFR